MRQAKVSSRFFTLRKSGADWVCCVRGKQAGRICREGKLWTACAAKSGEWSPNYETFSGAEMWLVA